MDNLILYFSDTFFMKKLMGLSASIFFSLLILQFGYAAVLAEGNDRLIVPATSGADKQVFKQLGCEIIHELNDATAISCKKGISIPNARPDHVYEVLDLNSGKQIKANLAWGNGLTGAGVTVAVLDTGIDYRHPQLISSSGSSSLHGRCFLGPEIGCDNGFLDDHGHGTSVRGLIT